MHVINPLSFFQHNSKASSQQVSPSTYIPRFFISKADAKAKNAYALLHPDSSEPASIMASLNTGKLTKLANYIRNGIPY